MFRKRETVGFDKSHIEIARNLPRNTERLRDQFIIGGCHRTCPLAERKSRAKTRSSNRLHVDHAGDRLQRTGDLRRDLEAAGKTNLNFGFDIQHHHQRHLAVTA